MKIFKFILIIFISISYSIKADSKKTLIDEFMYNYDNYGITYYMVSDDTLNDSKQKVN